MLGQQHHVTVANYTTVGDGRIRFTAGWGNFALDCKLYKGMLLLILFHDINGEFQITFDAIGH